MRIRFLRDYKFAHQGMFPELFIRGREHDADEDLLKTALADGAAELVEAVPVEKTVETDTPGKPGEPEGSGQETPAASLPPAQASRQPKRNTSKAKRGS
jgi:hypothetical protein